MLGKSWVVALSAQKIGVESSYKKEKYCDNLYGVDPVVLVVVVVVVSCGGVVVDSVLGVVVVAVNKFTCQPPTDNPPGDGASRKNMGNRIRFHNNSIITSISLFSIYVHGGQIHQHQTVWVKYYYQSHHQF